MVLKKWIVWMLLCLPLVATGQVEADIEQWVEETGDDEAAQDLADRLAEYRQHPPNLNDTSAHLSLLSPFQQQALRNYIILHGPLLSHDELHFVPGFDSLTIATVRALTTVGPLPARPSWRLADGRHTLVTAVGGTMEEAAGYRDSTYDGDRWRALAVYNYSLHNRLQLRLVAEKDPTEAWGKGNFVSYHLMLNDIGRIERLIVGRYNLQFGQGLTLWTGLKPFTFMGSTPLRFAGGVRAASALYEADYQTGVATTVRLTRRVNISAFGSRNGGETLYGTHLGWRSEHLLLGLTAVHCSLDSARTLRNYLYNQLYFRGQQQTNIGLDFVWQYATLTLFGELAVGENGKPAMLGGVQLQPADEARMGLTVRYFHPEYHNLHAQPYAIGNGQGEAGATFDASVQMPFGVRATASVDVHRFPSLRYGSYQPSQGEWLRLQLLRQAGRHTQAQLRYTYRLKERNIPYLDTNLYLGEQTVRRQLQADVRWTRGCWSLTGRGSLVHFDSENGEPQRGLVLGVQGRYEQGAIRATAALAYHDVEGYYARIYYSESTLQYAWSIPALNGRGWRANLVLHYRFSQHLLLAARYTLAWIPSAEAIGSGASATEGPVRQTLMLQLRWSS